MAGRWSDDQERYWRDQDREWVRERRDDRYDAFGLDDGDERWSGSENRTFDRGSERGRARVLGERDSGAGYNAPPGGGRHAQRPDANRHGRGGWQDRDYEGVSPAMRRVDYETGYRADPILRGHDAPHGRFGSYEADQRWEREMRRPAERGVYSGGTGGYDYERGYGDGGREEPRGEGFEDRAREAGDFFRRTGQRISNWFSDVAGEGEDRRRQEEYRGARGLGPKGYKRSDERISDDVHQRLADDAWLDASNINVSVSGGEVTLSGTVDSREAKHRAERIVEDLSGVNHVQNNLRVQAGGYFTSAGKGYGDSVQEARMASPDAVKDVTDGNATPPAQKRN